MLRASVWIAWLDGRLVECVEPNGVVLYWSCQALSACWRRPWFGRRKAKAKMQFPSKFDCVDVT